MTWTRWMIGGTDCALLAVVACGAVAMSFPAASERPERQRSQAQTGRDLNSGPVASRQPLAQTLQQASLAASALTDPQDVVDAQIALAWAQIKISDQVGARASLDRAGDASIARDPETRCPARVRIAQVRGEVADRERGIALLTMALQDAGVHQPPQSWALKSIAVAQSELGDLEAARATISALELAILSPDQHLKGVWTSSLSDLAAARLAIGDFDSAFGTCFASLPAGGANRHFLVPLSQQPWMLTQLASAAADSNHESRKDAPRRTLTAAEHAARLALVLRAVAAVETLPEPNEHRPILAASLGVLGAFPEALEVARRIDQKQIRQRGAVDATWALRRISMEQATKGKLDDAKATMHEARSTVALLGTEDLDRRQTLAFGYVVARDFDAALTLAESLKPEGRAEILSLIAEHKRGVGAEPLFRRALEEAKRFRDGPPPLREPRHSLPNLVASTEDPQNQHKISALSLLAVIHARSGDWHSATENLTAIPVEGKKKGVIAFRIAAMRAHSGDVAGALAWARSLSTTSLRAWAIRGASYGISDENASQF
jgi:hypothetical protein